MGLDSILIDVKLIKDETPLALVLSPEIILKNA
jgi:hypothetical protein